MSVNFVVVEMLDGVVMMFSSCLGTECNFVLFFGI